MDNDALKYALKLLKRRDYSQRELRRRLEPRFGPEIESVVEWLEFKGYIDDRRFAERFLGSHPQWGALRMDAELEKRGVAEGVRTPLLAQHKWPSVREMVGDRMARLKVEPPLTDEAAARIARTLGRLGYDPTEIEDELERLI